jgi:hypothetical protein
MGQLRLFPPPGSILAPLPKDARDAARELLAEMLAAVVERNKVDQDTSAHEGETDE